MAIALTSYSLVPELQHWFHVFVLNSEINKNLIPPPTNITDTYMPTSSFIEMLFNDNYSGSSYEYRYIEESNMGCIPRMAYYRLQIYPGSWKYLTLDETGDNIFSLQPDDFVLLNALLAYRNGYNDSTSFLMVDSTTTYIVQDTTAHVLVLYANYNSLSTELSKMIYLYLRLNILGDFSLYNNNFKISTGGLLQCCYEAYLLDAYFSFMTEREPDLIYNCNCPDGDN
jgi:hypothetical protein